jgi:dTDP-4-amino-4,6-dideoxygalactose transaminase
MKINIVNPQFENLNKVSEKFNEVLNSKQVTNNSKYVRKFENNLKQFLQSKNQPVCFNNGEMALFSLIQAWKYELGYKISESFDVLVPSFTFVGTINAICMNNLRPVFIDIDENFLIDFSQIKKISKNVKMIIPVGVYGNLPNMEQLKKFCRKNEIICIFDNAPAFGSKYKNKYPINYGFDEIWSFHATKIMSSMEGGAAVSSSKKITSLLQRVRDFGQFEKYRGNVDIPGLNGKMQEVSAIVGIENLKEFSKNIKLRKKVINKYLYFFKKLENKNCIKLMKVSNDVSCLYLYFPIIIKKDVKKFIQYMKERNINIRRYYTAVHDLKYYKNRYEENDLYFTNKIKNNIIALPIYSKMSDNKVNYLFSSIKNFFNKRI